MSDFITLTCPNCGGQINFPKGTPRIKCSYCGTDHILTGEAARQVQMEGLPVCPICKKDDRLEKVSAIVKRTDGASQLIETLTLPQPVYGRISEPSYPARPDLQREPVQNTSNSADKKISRRFFNILLAILFSPCLMIMSMAKSMSMIDTQTWFIFGSIIFAFLAVLALGNALLSDGSGEKNNFWHLFRVLFFSLIMLLAVIGLAYLQISSGKFSWVLTGIGLVILVIDVRYLFKIFSAKLTIASVIPENTPAPWQKQYQEQMGTYRRQIALYERGQSLNLKKKRDYEQHLEIWNELYYCHRDDCVCLPRLGLYAEAKDMEAFVNEQWWQRYKASI